LNKGAKNLGKFQTDLLWKLNLKLEYVSKTEKNLIKTFFILSSAVSSTDGLYTYLNFYI